MDSSSSTIHPNIRYDFKPTNNQRQPLRLHRQDHGARSSVIRRRVPSVGRSLIGGKPPASLFWGAFARFRPVVAGAIFRARNRDRKEKVVRRRGQNPDWKWSGIRAPGFFFFFLPWEFLSEKSTSSHDVSHDQGTETACLFLAVSFCFTLALNSIGKLPS